LDVIIVERTVDYLGPCRRDVEKPRYLSSNWPGSSQTVEDMLAGREHPYLNWLDDMERWLEVTQGKRQSS